mgnify:CR=1 FL=1
MQSEYKPFNITCDKKVNIHINEWLDNLVLERRLSAKTGLAYETDMKEFMTFLSEHLDSPVDLSHLKKLQVSDFRAFGPEALRPKKKGRRKKGDTSEMQKNIQPI